MNSVCGIFDIRNCFNKWSITIFLALPYKKTGNPYNNVYERQRGGVLQYYKIN